MFNNTPRRPVLTLNQLWTIKKAAKALRAIPELEERARYHEARAEYFRRQHKESPDNYSVDAYRHNAEAVGFRNAAWLKRREVSLRPLYHVKDNTGAPYRNTIRDAERVDALERAARGLFLMAHHRKRAHKHEKEGDPVMAEDHLNAAADASAGISLAGAA